MNNNQKFTAVIFSAGMARRLYPITAKLPKNLIRVDQDRTILDLQIEALGMNELVGEIVIVVGFEHQHDSDLPPLNTIPGLCDNLYKHLFGNDT